ncbi:MAG: TolC family protein [Flavobacteriaceae bacterium]
MRKLAFSILLFLLISTSLSAQSKNVYNVGILVDFTSEETTPLFDRLQTEITSVVGEDAVINFPAGSILVNNYNLQKARENYDLLIKGDTDIILAFGPVNNEVISNIDQHLKPTILFGAVNRDLSELDFTKETSGIENLTYLIESESFEEDLKKFKELTNFKNLGIAVEEAVVDILPFKEVFDRELNGLEASYKLIPFSTVEDIISELEGIDAIYLAGGFFISQEENQLLAKTFIDKKIPSFTINGTDDVIDGIMATNQSDDNLDQFFRRIALSIESYINGTPLKELPVYIDYTPRLTINYNTAESIGVPIRFSLLAQTDFVGEFKNVLSEKQYNLLVVIDEALKNNLSLQSSQRDVALSTQDVKSAVSNYIPSITASSTGTYIDPDLAEISNGQNPEFSTSGNITLQQTLFSEAANANIAIQKNLQKAQEANLNAAELDLIFDAANVYFNALILKANLQIQSQNLDLTKKNLQIASQNFEAGESGK